MIKGEARVTFVVTNIDPSKKDNMIWFLDRIRTAMKEIGNVPSMDFQYSEYEDASSAPTD